ncbi:hypothetical protein BT69DRAFT_964574 [Atractiella rhizophila]|nr:hypothetical protein BT69DRAFT_964574 [Atractiella rhizophila]
MLLLAGAVVRVVNRAIGRDATHPYIVIAYYITNALVARQYLLCIDSDMRTVKYLEETFNLHNPEEAFRFLLELYNCLDVIDSKESEIATKATKIIDSLTFDHDLPSFKSTSASNKKRKATHQGDRSNGNDGGLLAVPCSIFPP